MAHSPLTVFRLTAGSDGPTIGQANTRVCPTGTAGFPAAHYYRHPVERFGQLAEGIYQGAREIVSALRRRGY